MSFLGGGLLQRIGRRGGPAANNAASGLGGWAVGGSPRELPDGLARRLPAGADMIVQMHFHPSGKIEREQATIGFYFADGAPKRTLSALQLPVLFGAFAGIDIPPGEKRFVIRDSFTLPVDVEVIGSGAHAHFLAKDMRMTALLPSGAKKDLLRIQN